MILLIRATGGPTKHSWGCSGSSQAETSPHSWIWGPPEATCQPTPSPTQGSGESTPEKGPPLPFFPVFFLVYAFLVLGENLQRCNWFHPLPQQRLDGQPWGEGTFRATGRVPEGLQRHSTLSSEKSVTTSLPPPAPPQAAVHVPIGHTSSRESSRGLCSCANISTGGHCL